jgi:hypothetical protein
MNLQTQTPFGVIQAEAERELSVAFAVGAVHRLQEEMPEALNRKLLRIQAGLGIDQLYFVTIFKNGMHANYPFTTYRRLAPT